MTSRRRSAGHRRQQPVGGVGQPVEMQIARQRDVGRRARRPAAAAGGHARPANHHTPPTASPMTAPTTGNQSSVPEDGTAAPAERGEEGDGPAHQRASGRSRRRRAARHDEHAPRRPRAATAWLSVPSASRNRRPSSVEGCTERPTSSETTTVSPVALGQRRAQRARRRPSMPGAAPTQGPSESTRTEPATPRSTAGRSAPA